jgi:DNA-directed RNA polymerase subunit H (RpoH/RPB5)
MFFKSEILLTRENVNVVEVVKKNDLKSLTPEQCEGNLYVVPDDFESWNNVNKECHRFIFRNSELKYNILNNTKLVPSHKLVSNHNLNIARIPVILSYDPVVRRMNLKPGDIIEVDNRVCIIDPKNLHSV